MRLTHDGLRLTQLARFLRLLCAIVGPAAIVALHVVMWNTVDYVMTDRSSVKPQGVLAVTIACNAE